MKKTIYLIPGVGADDTVFSKLDLPDYEIIHLKWVKPRKGEQLKPYVKRLLPQIKKDTQPIFIGLSFGGIVAIELSKLVETFRVILISSIKTFHERPYKMSMFNLLRVYKMMPTRLALKFKFWHSWAFGHLNKDEECFVMEMLKKMDIKFNEWAVDQAINWKNDEPPRNIIHIHGDSDAVFPNTYIRNYHKIRGGTHFMIVRKAKEISAIIHDELEKAELLDQPKRRIKGRKTIAA